MTERLKFQGRLLEREREAERLRTLLRGLRAALREALDPIEPVDELDRDAIVQQATEFGLKQIELVGVMAEIRAIKRELGER